MKTQMSAVTFRSWGVFAHSQMPEGHGKRSLVMLKRAWEPVEGMPRHIGISFNVQSRSRRPSKSCAPG